MKVKRCLSELITALILVLVQALPGSAQENSAPENVDAHSSISTDPDQTYFYAFLQDNPSGPEGPLLQMFKDQPAIKNLILPRNSLERKFRPMLQLKAWADKKQRFFPSLFFLCLVGFLSWAVCPAQLQLAAEECRKNFWKSFGTGLILAMICMTLARTVFLSQIGWPFGIVLIGVSQGVALLGLSVALYNLGHAVSLLLRLNRISFLTSSPSRARASDVFIGCILSALILLIPPFGHFPPWGTRLLSFFALLGVGALYRELKRRQRQSAE